jgi:hypothetical protein
MNDGMTYEKRLGIDIHPVRTRTKLKMAIEAKNSLAKERNTTGIKTTEKSLIKNFGR